MQDKIRYSNTLKRQSLRASTHNWRTSQPSYDCTSSTSEASRCAPLTVSFFEARSPWRIELQLHPPDLCSRMDQPQVCRYVLLMTHLPGKWCLQPGERLILQHAHDCTSVLWMLLAASMTLSESVQLFHVLHAHKQRIFTRWRSPIVAVPSPHLQRSPHTCSAVHMTTRCDLMRQTQGSEWSTTFPDPDTTKPTAAYFVSLMISPVGCTNSNTTFVSDDPA
jgi:hypothetical protein